MVVDDGILSLVTIGYFMNATTFNQGNHCIITYNVSRSAIDVGNEALLSTQGRCDTLEDTLRSIMAGPANLIFSQTALSALGSVLKA